MRNIATVAAIVFILAFLVPGPPSATADTAKNLKCKGCVGTKDLGTNSVTRKKIKDKSITADKLADGVIPILPAADLDFVYNDTLTDVTDVEQSFAQFELNAPSAGFVVATASGNFTRGGTGSFTNTVICRFDDGTTNSMYFVGDWPSEHEINSFSQTHVIVVYSPGVVSVDWKCVRDTINATTPQLAGYEVVGVFIPNQP